MPLRAACALLACSAAMTWAACGGGDEQSAATGDPTAETAVAPAGDTGGAAAEPVGEWGWETVSSSDFPRADGSSYLVDVRASRHEGGADGPAFDRVVLELEGDEPPSWRVAPEDPPIVQDPSGLTVDVEGEAFLRLTLHPASGWDRSGDEPEARYGGPERIPVDGRLVTELVWVTDHQGALAWVLGLVRPAPFAVSLLADPPRLVVDVVDENGG